MIFLLQYLTIKNLIICLLILYTITLVVQQNQNRKKIYTKEFLEANNERPLVVLKHLDYYYVTNIYYTVIAVFLYIGFTVLLLIYLRYTFIGYQRMLIDISLTNAGLHLLWVFLLFSIIFILYRRFLDIIFYPHVIRLHFYLYSNKYYQMWVDFEQTNYHIGSYLGSYSASLYSYVTFDYELQNKHMKEWDDKYIPDIVQRRARRAKWHSFFKQYKIIYWVFKYPIQSFLWFISSRSGFFFYYIPHMIVCYSFLYDLYYMNFYYIYYALFYFVVFNSLDKIRYFLHVKDPVYDNLIHKYFYKGQISYHVMRNYLKDKDNNKIDIYIKDNIICQRANTVMYSGEELIPYLVNDLKVYYILDEDRAFNTRWSYIYHLQMHLIILALIVGIFILFTCSYTIFFSSIELPKIFLCCLIPLMVYFTINISYDPLIKKRINKRYCLLFWIITSLQAFLFYIVLFKPILIIPENEVLFDVIFRITKSYTINDKIMYLYQYFEHYMKFTALTIEKQELLRYKLRLEDFTAIIDTSTTFLEIQQKVKDFIRIEYYKDIILEMEAFLELYYKEEVSSTKQLPQIVIFLRNTIIIATIISLLGIYKVALDIQDPSKLYSIIRYLWKIIN